MHDSLLMHRALVDLSLGEANPDPRPATSDPEGKSVKVFEFWCNSSAKC